MIFLRRFKNVRLFSTNLSPIEKFDKEITSGRLRPDHLQRNAMLQLENLYNDITDLARKNEEEPVKTSSFFSFFKKEINPPERKQTVKGLYMYGGVGTGKTMLMDMFYEAVPLTKKRRQHFHSFMLNVHQRLHAQRKARGGLTNPLVEVARTIALEEATLLCLDEFQVTDVADAMILKELFTTIMDHGGILVATSNRAPDELYLGGINREAFIPFIHELKTRCVVYALEGDTDHRLLGTLSSGVYHTPLNEGSQKALDKIYTSIQGKQQSGPKTIDVMMGRHLTIEHQVPHLVARFNFEELCDRPLSAADFIALAEQYPNIIIDKIPLMPSNEREKIRRFIILLDILYEERVRLICSAAAPPADLFPVAPSAFSAPRLSKKGPKREDEQFAASRAVSRLIEMQSKEYIESSSAKRKALQESRSP